MHRALTRLGFTCHDAVVTPAAAPAAEVSAEGWGW
jgi:hypothetical protein